MRQKWLADRASQMASSAALGGVQGQAPPQRSTGGPSGRASGSAGRHRNKSRGNSRGSATSISAGRRSAGSRRPRVPRASRPRASQPSSASSSTSNRRKNRPDPRRVAAEETRQAEPAQPPPQQTRGGHGFYNPAGAAGSAAMCGRGVTGDGTPVGTGARAGVGAGAGAGAGAGGGMGYETTTLGGPPGMMNAGMHTGAGASAYPEHVCWRVRVGTGRHGTRPCCEPTDVPCPRLRVLLALRGVLCCCHAYICAGASTGPQQVVPTYHHTAAC